MDQLFLRAARFILDPPDKKAVRNPVDIEYATHAGEVVKGKVICTSSSFVNDTFNFKFMNSGEIRTVHACLLLSVNNKEIFL